MTENKIKQVIVVRKDLNMRSGKIASQAAHAAMLFILRKLQDMHTQDREYNISVLFSAIEQEWMFGSFVKIVVGVNSEQELLEIHKKAQAVGIVSNIMIDNGDTEFHGVRTVTALAVGPDYSSKIDPITKDLKLL